MSTPEDKLDKVNKDDLEKGPAAPPGSEVAEGSSENGDTERNATEGSSNDDSYSGKITVDVGENLAQKARSAVYYTPGLRLYDLAKEGLRRVIADIEERRGKPLPMDVDKLKGGRPSTMERENIIDWINE